MDDDNERNEDDEDEEETAIRSYSKKKHFGKLDKGINRFSFKATYSPKIELLKPLKITFDSPRLRFDHKKQFDGTKVTTKVNLNFKKMGERPAVTLNSKINRKIGETSLQLSNEVSDNLTLITKFAHSLNVWRFRIKYGLDFESKSSSFGGTLSAEYKDSFSKIPFSAFITQYNYFASVGTTLKSNKQSKLDVLYKSHLTTKDSHKAYLELKSSHDPNNKNGSPFSHTLTLNVQDSEAIGTINTSLELTHQSNFQNLAIKSKEVRFLIEYDKKYRFGVQKRNENVEFLMERYRMNQKLLKSMRLYVGNKGFLGMFEGRFGLGRSNVDYTLNLKLKTGGGNFYNDFSMGASLKWNI